MDSTLLPDTVRTKALLERIAEEREWSNDNVESDLAILEKNRLVYVRDLRSLSKESWAVIELLPIVKDLLRNAIDPEWSSKYDEHEQKSMNGGKKNANNKKKNKSKDESSSENDDGDAKKKDNKKKKGAKKEKKPKGFVSSSTLGTPVVPTVLSKLSEEPSSFMEDTPAPDTLGDILSDDHLTIQNTIRNGSISLDDNSSSSNISNDDDNDNDDDDDEVPVSPNGTRRKSVTFANETAVGIAASEKTETISKKEKKKDKKEKKKEKKNKDKMASISNINGVHNFTNHPIVKFKKMKKEHCRKLPQVPANDLFLQNLYNKLITASGQSI